MYFLKHSSNVSFKSGFVLYGSVCVCVCVFMLGRSESYDKEKNIREN